MSDNIFYNDKIILITGAAGSIGTELCIQLSKFNIKKIIALDYSELAIHNFEIKLKMQKTSLRLEYELADIRNEKHINKIIKRHQPNIIFHAAALKQLPILEKFPSEAVLTNIKGSRNVIISAIKNNIENFIFVSTDKAVEPTSVMGATKKITEDYISQIKHEHTKFSIVRFGNVYNSNGSAIGVFNKQIEKREPVTITDPKIERYFISIEKACESIIKACVISKGTEVFIIDMGKPRKIIEIVNELIFKKGLTPNKDIKIMTIGMREGEKLKEKLVDDEIRLLPTDVSKISYYKQLKNEEYFNLSDLENLLDSAKNRKDSQVRNLLIKLIHRS